MQVHAGRAAGVPAPVPANKDHVHAGQGGGTAGPAGNHWRLPAHLAAEGGRHAAGQASQQCAPPSLVKLTVY